MCIRDRSTGDSKSVMEQPVGAVGRSLLQDLRASAAKQAENAPDYAYGVARPSPVKPAPLKPGERPSIRDRNSAAGLVAPPKNGRALDLANESPRIDALTLKNKLNADLAEKNTRPDGICPVRRELFSNCFDDVSRRVTQDCSERGLMLQSIRDQFQLTMDAYRTVFEGSVDRVTNTAWQSDSEIGSLRAYISSVEEDVAALENKVSTMEAEKHRAADEGSEALTMIREEHARKVKAIEDNNAQIESFISELKKAQAAAES
eukprot:TRINITY_DN8459_c0_g1_i2.p1 TRINITY_DN8459_c0_g1~~TRINITY_DN8459_c0_g1_i2.p1  ORF type:complete len:261 (-),score=55.31 TRINITY_DN8459_c0_g1_i2:39-821(-)